MSGSGAPAGLRRTYARRAAILGAVAGLLLVGVAAAAPAGPPAAGDRDSVYTLGRPSRDGIGKFYRGREIAKVMGHQAVDWLERPEREQEERPDAVVRGMGLAPDAVVADIGAGSGYFTFRLAREVPDGRVLAVDVQREMLDLIRRRMAETGATNVEPILGRVDDPGLPAGEVDAVLMVDAYHEFSHPYEMMLAVRRALRPGGRVFLVEYRGEDDSVPIKPLHRMTQDQVILEMAAVGLDWLGTGSFLPSQHFMAFEKPRGD